MVFLQVRFRGLPGGSTPSISDHHNFVGAVDAYRPQNSRERSSALEREMEKNPVVNGEKSGESWMGCCERIPRPAYIRRDGITIHTEKKVLINGLQLRKKHFITRNWLSVSPHQEVWIFGTDNQAHWQWRWGDQSRRARITSYPFI
jgi:hypothetical protein